MFELDLPWWELVLRASLIYIALLVMMRFTGKRTVGQFTPCSTGCLPKDLCRSATWTTGVFIIIP